MSIATGLFSSDAVYEIQSNHSKRLLNVAGGDMESGAAVQLWDERFRCNLHNEWRIHETREGVFEIQSNFNRRFLNVIGGETEEGTGVHLWDDELGANPHNEWRIYVTRPGVYEIQSNYNGRFLNLAGGCMDEGAAIHLWDAEVGVNSHNEWCIVSTQRYGPMDMSELSQNPAPGSVYIMSAFSGKAVDFAPDDSDTVHLWEIHGASNQAWNIVPSAFEKGFVNLSSRGGILFLAINAERGREVAEGAGITTCYASDVEEGHIAPEFVNWRLQQPQPGLFQIVSQSGGMVLTVCNSQFANGTRLEVCNSFGSDINPDVTQLWRLVPAPSVQFPFLTPAEMDRFSFPFGDMENARNALSRYGFVLITGVLGHAEVREAVSLFGSDLMSICDEQVGLSPSTESAVISAFQSLASERHENVPGAWPAGEGFHPNSHGLAQGSCAWYVRTNERVRRVYAEMNYCPMEELCTGTDMVFYYPMGTPGSERTHVWPHCDHNKRVPGPVYQGVVSLWDSMDDASATTVVWPGSHERFELIMENIDNHGVPPYVTLRDVSSEDDADRARLSGWLTEQFILNARRVPLPAGSLMLWDSRLIHQGWKEGERLAIPVCFEPKSRRSDEAFRRKLRICATGLASTHSASLGCQHPFSHEESLLQSHPPVVVDGRCVRLPIAGPLRSFCLRAESEAPLSQVRAACEALKSTDDQGVEEAAALAAMMKPEIVDLL